MNQTKERNGAMKKLGKPLLPRCWLRQFCPHAPWPKRREFPKRRLPLPRLRMWPPMPITPMRRSGRWSRESPRERHSPFLHPTKPVPRLRFLPSCGEPTAVRNPRQTIRLRMWKKMPITAKRPAGHMKRSWCPAMYSRLTHLVPGDRRCCFCIFWRDFPMLP